MRSVRVVQKSHRCKIGVGKSFEPSNLRSFATHSKLNFSLRSFAATPTLMFAHAHSCNLNVWSIMWACSIKVEAVLLAASVSFLCPAMLNRSRNSDMNKTSTRYKAIILFWTLSIANQGKTNIDKNTCEPSNLRSFLLTKLRRLFSHLRPSPSVKRMLRYHQENSKASA